MATRRPGRVLLGWAIYAVLLAASHTVQFVRAPGPGTFRNLAIIEVPMTDDDGRVGARTQRIALRRWDSAAAGASRGAGLADEPARIPVVLLHGSPGESGNFTRLGPELAASGYEVLAPDLPGFGGSTKDLPSYSFRAHAHALLELLDAEGIERAHVAGWSQGGGVALWMAHLAPERVASVTLMASVGVQEAEGSGSYHFEHLKYAVGYAGLVLGGELVPHFGVLQSHSFRRSFIRNFWDSDQRPLRGIMVELDTPTLILHGRDDFLTPLRAATVSHELIGPSRLIVSDASHFLPVMQAEQVAADMAVFLDDRAAGFPVERQAVVRAPEVNGLANTARRGFERTPWWVLLIVGAALTIAWPETAAALLGFAVSMVWVDAGISGAALLTGLSLRTAWMFRRGRRGATGHRLGEQAMISWRYEASLGAFGLMLRTRLQPWRRDEAARAVGQGRMLTPGAAAGAVVGVGLWTALVCIAAMIAAAIVVARLGDSLPAMLTACGAAIVAVRLAVACVTWTGRRRALALLGRARRHEFWPAPLLYGPVLLGLIGTAIRSRGALTFTCINPVISAGGGVVGESKHAIQSSLEGFGEGVMRTVLLEPGAADTRLATLLDAVSSGRLPGGFPLVLKPDAGQRGYGVRIANDEHDAREYLARMTRPVVAQQYHPGPVEVGVLWVRERPPGTAASANRTSPAEDHLGRVFSVTAKAFPSLTGDGRHTIEQLIYRHPRYRMQADTLLKRMAGRRLEIPDRDRPVSLGRIGNHAQGAVFTDGSHLLTPELEAWIDRAAASFRTTPPQGLDLPPGDNGLDFGRFDIRAHSIEDLSRAHGLGIIEFNGATAESTNIYDPDRSALWAWGVLLSQWKAIFALGLQRREQGVRPMSPRALVRAWREFEHDRPDLDGTA